MFYSLGPQTAPARQKPCALPPGVRFACRVWVKTVAGRQWEMPELNGCSNGEIIEIIELNGWFWIATFDCWVETNMRWSSSRKVLCSGGLCPWNTVFRDPTATSGIGKKTLRPHPEARLLPFGQCLYNYTRLWFFHLFASHHNCIPPAWLARGTGD